MCVDLCGIDYSAWGAPTYAPQPGLHPQRFAVVVHLLSIKHNWRLRVRAYVANDEFPVLPTLVDVWPTVNWFEREAFDLYGIVRSEEHTSELQSLMRISYAVFCLKKKKRSDTNPSRTQHLR